MFQQDSNSTDDTKIIGIAFLSAMGGAAATWALSNRTNKKVTKNRLYKILKELALFGEQLKTEVVAPPKAKTKAKPAVKKIKAIKHEPLNEEEADHIRKHGEP